MYSRPSREDSDAITQFNEGVAMPEGETKTTVLDEQLTDTERYNQAHPDKVEILMTAAVFAFCALGVCDMMHDSSRRFPKRK